MRKLKGVVRKKFNENDADTENIKKKHRENNSNKYIWIRMANSETLMHFISNPVRRRTANLCDRTVCVSVGRSVGRTDFGRSLPAPCLLMWPLVYCGLCFVCWGVLCTPVQLLFDCSSKAMEFLRRQRFGNGFIFWSLTHKFESETLNAECQTTPTNAFYCDFSWSSIVCASPQRSRNHTHQRSAVVIVSWTVLHMIFSTKSLTIQQNYEN